MLSGNITGLRAIEKEDLQTLLEWRNNPALRVYFREFKELGMDHQLNWYNNIVLNSSTTIMFAIVDLENDTLVGVCGLSSIDWKNRSAEISLYIGKDDLYIDNYWAKDSLMILQNYATNELNLHRLWAEVYSIDEKKISLFNDLDYDLEGTFKHTTWARGVWMDSLFFGLLI